MTLSTESVIEKYKDTLFRIAYNIFLLNALCLKAVSVPRKKAVGHGMLMKNTHGLGGLHVAKVEIGSR